MSSAEQLTPNQHEQLNREHRLRTDTTTWLAETLHGSMRTHFEFHWNGLELYGEDGGALGKIFDYAIEAAQIIVNDNPNLAFELRRRLIEKDEYAAMLAMCRGEQHNTLVVISDFPPELMDSEEDVGGYNASRKQTMLRVITREPDGNLRMVTQSLDGSHRPALEAIYEYFDLEPDKGELLEQRIFVDCDPLEQEDLPDQLMAVYDYSLKQEFGGEWHAGLLQEDGRQRLDTYQFARDQQDLIEWFVAAKLSNSLEAEKLRYKLAATATERYEQALARGGLYLVKVPVSEYYEQTQYVAQILEIEMEQASQRAASRGDVFSGCGASVMPDMSTENQLKQSGYGNRTSETTSYKFDKHMYCISCQAPPKANEGKKMCGPCGLCRSCDRKAGGKG